MTMQSMTGFGRSAGQAGDLAFAWEIRSVNGRGFDLRLRLPTGFDTLEPALKERAAGALARGNVSATLTVAREAESAVSIDEDLLETLLDKAKQIARRIEGAPPPRAEALLGLPGVIRTRAPAATPGATLGETPLSEAESKAVADGFAEAVAALVSARAEEGARLAAITGGHLETIESHVVEARRLADLQPGQHRERLAASLAELLGDQAPVPEERLAQEIALLATKSDIREELDRLEAHVGAARALLADAKPVGRRLDFLMQEFNREANTLCSKSASVEMTRIGLALKAVIEQLREQVQNIE